MRANKIYRQSHLYTWPAHTLFGLFSSEIQVDTTLATAHCFSLISFRLKSNKATKVAPIVPTDSKQFQKSHFRSTENEQCLTETTPVHASVTTARIPMAIRHTIIKINLCCLLFSISSTCMGVLHHILRHCIIVRRTMACIPSNRSSREEMRIFYRTRL